jgi:hypothetical protein
MPKPAKRSPQDARLFDRRRAAVIEAIQECQVGDAACGTSGSVVFAFGLAS